MNNKVAGSIPVNPVK